MGRDLEEYKKKRDFRKTKEPKGEKGRDSANRWVVQKHDASSLHYDFRLEVDGVLKSWAVPKGPSTDPSEKRLAQPTEDHPLDYIDFEGVIPEGEYGAGTVLVWDTGTYENLSEDDEGNEKPIAEALDDGHASFRLDGEKIRGGYALTRIATGDDERWLLVKKKDDAADARRNPVSRLGEVRAEPRGDRRGGGRGVGVLSDPFEAIPEEAREALAEEGFPDWKSPMLATLVDEAFSDPDWLYERKLDGVRVVAYREGGDVRLMTRNRKNRNAAYPEIAEALAELEPDYDFVIDGEIIAFEGDVTSFARLQGRMNVQDPEKARATGVDVHYYVFDLLHLEGRDVTGVELRYRKSLLESAFEFDEPIRYTTHRNEEGEAFLKNACDRGWEGLIAKKAPSTYVHSRSRDWLKFKCVNEQEFVIGGYTKPHGERIGFGALLIGYYDDGDLVYAGKVGTGYDDETLEEMSSELESIERKTPPFDRGDPPEKEVHWVSPKLVCEIGFTEWTDGGKLRHPRFKGLRHDKEPDEVVREKPA